MEEIKVGEYIRTAKGEIGKVIDIANNFYYLDNMLARTEKSIVKHSKNIIDLIEPGDYVNGYLIIDKNNKILKYEDADYINGINEISNSEIKLIATKEQMASIEYKI